MKIELNSKYSIGNIVRKYKYIGESKDKVICPLCNGRHFVDNPNYNLDDDYDDEKLECPHCDKDGYIKTNYITERLLDSEIYRIEGIFIDVKKDGSVKYRYSINSTPELNNRASMYVSCSASEEDLELVRLR